MAGGQQIDSGIGTVVYAQDNPEEDALTGSAATAAQGASVQDFKVPLRSRKVGGGAAAYLLTGSFSSVDQGTATKQVAKLLAAPSSTFAQGAFAKTRSKVMTGTQLSASAGIITYTVSGGAIAVGTLTTDGAETPEQISLWLPVTGTVAQTATATCRYRLSPLGTWVTAHPLYRIQPQFQINTPYWGGPIQDGFAWPIIDLTPGQTYDVEVTVTEGANQVVQTITRTTRSLPPAAGTPNKTCTANDSTSLRNAINALAAGDVLEIPDGIYDITTPISVAKSGNANQLIYIRGQSRTGTVVRKNIPEPSSTGGGIFSLGTCSYLVFENMTIEGYGVEPSTPNAYIQAAIYQSSASLLQNYITIRNCIMQKIDRGIYMVGGGGHTYGDATTIRPDTDYNRGILIYDNTLTGNNIWSESPVDYFYTTRTFNDHGITAAGRGNVAFQNSLSYFGDAFSHAEHAGGAECDSNAVHYYRNEIRTCLDDPIESDHARRNITFYDNRCHNVMNMSSFDPIYGGPCLIARNTYVNILRSRLHKWNSTNAGQFIYSNTSIQGIVHDQTLPPGPVTLGDYACWYQPNNGAQRSFGYRNNLHVYRGNAIGPQHGTLVINSAPGGSPFDNYDPLDWTHNSWSSNFTWKIPHNSSGGTTFANLAAAQAGVPDVVPIFSGQPRPYYQDNICPHNPWTQTITFTGDARTEYTGTFYPVLAAGNAKNTGVHIPNITDGYSGAAPDRGAVIEGRAVVAYGDQTGVVVEPTIPAWVETIQPGFMASIPIADADRVGGANCTPGAAWQSKGDSAQGSDAAYIDFPNHGTHGGLVLTGGGHGHDNYMYAWMFDLSIPGFRPIHNPTAPFGVPYQNTGPIPGGPAWKWDDGAEASAVQANMPADATFLNNYGPNMWFKPRTSTTWWNYPNSLYPVTPNLYYGECGTGVPLGFHPYNFMMAIPPGKLGMGALGGIAGVGKASCTSNSAQGCAWGHKLDFASSTWTRMPYILPPNDTANNIKYIYGNTAITWFSSAVKGNHIYTVGQLTSIIKTDLDTGAHTALATASSNTKACMNSVEFLGDTMILCTFAPTDPVSNYNINPNTDGSWSQWTVRAVNTDPALTSAQRQWKNITNWSPSNLLPTGAGNHHGGFMSAALVWVPEVQKFAVYSASSTLYRPPSTGHLDPNEDWFGGPWEECSGYWPSVPTIFWITPPANAQTTWDTGVWQIETEVLQIPATDPYIANNNRDNLNPHDGAWRYFHWSSKARCFLYLKSQADRHMYFMRSTKVP